MAKTYSKSSDGCLEEKENVEVVERFSLDVININIKTLTSQLAVWNKRLTEANKLNLK